MPIYEYHCEKCSSFHEIMQKFSDPQLTQCPKCGGTVKKLISMTSFALKGSGWYTTDYKRAPATKKETSPTPAPEKTPEKVPVNTSNDKKSKDLNGANQTLR